MSGQCSLVGYNFSNSSFLPGDIWTFILTCHLRHPSCTTWALRLVNKYFHFLVTKKLRKYYRYFCKAIFLLSTDNLAVTSEQVLIFPLYYPPYRSHGATDSIRVFAFDPQTANNLSFNTPVDAPCEYATGEMSRAATVHLLQKAGEKSQSLILTYVMRKGTVDGVLVHFFGDASILMHAQGSIVLHWF